MILGFLLHGSGTSIITALGNSMPENIRNSSALSNMAESEPLAFITGITQSMSFAKISLFMVSSRACMRSILPRIVFISPLCKSTRLG